MIHVCFGLHDKTGHYAKFTGTTMLSLFDNTNTKVTVHILHDNTLTQDNRDKFIYLAGRYNQLVKFYNVEKLCADKIAAIFELIPAVRTSRTSIGTFFKFLISQVLPANIDKCIYLDSDMIINLDIKELWHVEIGNNPLASCPELVASNGYYKAGGANKYLIRSSFVQFEDYFNAALLILNLPYLRNAEAQIMEGIKFRGEHPQCECFDQDVWNYLFSKNYLKLSGKFDQFTGDERILGRSSTIREVIYHFAGTDRGTGLSLNMNDRLNRLWLSYYMKTPWFDEDTIGRLYTGFQQVHVGLKGAMVNLTAIMSGKTRAFFAPPNDIDGLKKFFAIRPDEKIIAAENQESIQKLLDAMKKARGRRVFFIMIPYFPFQVLTEAGFVSGKDFVNGMEFLSEAQGVPLNSYPLIKAM